MATANTNLSNYDSSTLPNATKFRFGIVVSEWNPQITEGLLKGALDALLDCGVEHSNIKTIHVPGSFELIFGAKMMQQQHVDAVIAIGMGRAGEDAAAAATSSHDALVVLCLLETAVRLCSARTCLCSNPPGKEKKRAYARIAATLITMVRR